MHNAVAVSCDLRSSVFNLFCIRRNWLLQRPLVPYSLGTSPLLLSSSLSVSLMATIQPLSPVKPIKHPRDAVFSSELRAVLRKPFSLVFPKTSAAPIRGGSARWFRIHAKLQAVSSSQSAKAGSTVDASCDGVVQRPWKTYDARLVLEDGSIWRAKSFGASGTQVGEVVFNTSLTGYQEILTDPSYAGQFVLMTNPHIGNTGVNPDDEESGQCFLAGLVIRNLSICTSNWRCAESLGDYLAKRNIMGIYDVDTRAITRRLRQDGSLIGVLSTEESRSDEELLEMARRWKIVGVDLISGVSCDAPYEWAEKTDAEWEFSNDRNNTESFHVVAYDFGVKHNILRRLASYGCRVTVVPSKWPALETLKLKPDGVLFSNGPGDPAAVPYAVETVKEIIGKVPVFGICMGHQLLGQALGGRTFKMKFGHHGGNHPVCDLHNGRVEISAQNHNYAVDPASLPAGVEVTHINLNDNSCAGLACSELKIMSLQYHPESSPGPHDSDPAFRGFIDLMKANRM